MADIHHSVSKSNAQSAVEDVRKLQSSVDDHICCIAGCSWRSQATDLVEESDLLVWEGSDKEVEVEVGPGCNSKYRLRVSVALMILEEILTARVHSTRPGIPRRLIAVQIYDTHPRHQRCANRRMERIKRREHCSRECPASERFARGGNEETYAGGKVQVVEEQKCIGDVSSTRAKNSLQLI